MRWIALILAVLTLLLSPAVAQEPGDEDRLLVCPVISELLAKRIATEIKGQGRCSAFCRGCGCKGGPGYRASDDRCVGYADLIRKCGSPPHAGCTRECAPIAAACLGHVAGRAWLRTFASGLGQEVKFLPAEVQKGGTPAQAEGEPKR